MPTRRKPEKEDLAKVYSRIRKPVPPPERVERDRRRRLAQKQARRQLDDELSARGGDKES